MTYEQLLAAAPSSSQIGDVAAAKVYVDLLTVEQAANKDVFTVSQSLYIYRLLRKWEKRTTVIGAWQPPGRPMKETTKGESRSIAAVAMRRHERENESPLLKTIMNKFGKPREDEFKYLKYPKAKP